jgi:septal ring factor EnvC (AmiA/AmiB activator)
MPNLTLQERERRAYIENDSTHPLIVLALEGDEDARAQIDDLEQAATLHDDEVSRLLGEIEDKDTEVATLEDKLAQAEQTIFELRAKLEAKPKARKPAKRETVSDLL